MDDLTQPAILSSDVLLFHINWGWGGPYNGYYYYNYWSVGGDNYQYNHAMDYNIHP